MPDFYLLIPCYNNVEGLITSLQSVNYPFHLFSVIIVDDGSQEPVRQEQLYQHLPKELSIHIIRLEKNAGITKALNTGLESLHTMPEATFIARLDCGDTCAPDRFQQQVAFLRSNPDINLVGSWCLFRDQQSGSSYKYITPTEHARILKSMHFRNVFIHPTVMWRHDPQKPLLYPEIFPHAEDYGFFHEILIWGKSAVLPGYLVTCELNENGISITNRKKQLKSRMNVVRAYGKDKVLSALGILKLRTLMLIPYHILFRIKKTIYSA